MVVLAAAFGIGCGLDTRDGPPDRTRGRNAGLDLVVSDTRSREDVGPDRRRAAAASVHDAFMSGEIGSVATFSGEARSHSLMVNADRVALQLFADTHSHRAAMLYLTFANDDALWQPTSAPRRRDAYVYGCAGPATGDWTFDAPADSVDVLVGAGANPGDLDVVFDVVFSFELPRAGGGVDWTRNSVHGGFVLRPAAS
jgi:hypothetical protein